MFEDLFKPKSLVAQRKRRFGGVTYWYITTVQNRVQAAMVRASLHQQGRHVQVSKKKTKMLGIEYDVWATDR